MTDQPKFVFGKANKKYAVTTGVVHGPPKAAPATPPVARKAVQTKVKAKVMGKKTKAIAPKQSAMRKALLKEAAGISKRKASWYN